MPRLILFLLAWPLVVLARGHVVKAGNIKTD